MRSLLLSLLLLSFGPSCAKKSDSSDVKTSGIAGHFSVTRSETDTSKVNCQAYFHLNSDENNRLELSGDDYVTCNGQTLAGSSTTYTTQLDYVANGVYEVVFHRTGEQYTCTITLPTPPTVSYPTPGAQHTKGTILNVNYTASTSDLDSINVLLDNNQSGDQLIYTNEADAAPESGVVAIPASRTTVSNPGAGAWGSYVKVTRTRQGNHDGNISGSSSGIVSTKVNFDLID